MMPRKIAYLTPLYFDEASCLGGGERFPLNLARGVVEASGRRCQIDLISFGQSATTRRLSEGVGLRVLPIAGRPSNPLDVVSWDLPAVIADYDLIHIHQAYTRCAELGILLSRQMRKPVCVTDHGGTSSTLGIELGSLELVDRVVAYSQFGASLYRTTRPIEIIRGGVDADTFRPPINPVTRDRILFVGRLLPHKGIDRLLEALPPELPLTVCGRAYSADYFATLQRLAQGKRVEFVTDAGDAAIRDLYARSWATVLPSVYRDLDGNTYEAPELMGFTLLESMSCRTPAVASRVGAMPEFIRHGETGFVYDTLDELTSILRTLASDPRRVEQVGASARESVETQFDLHVAGAKLLAVYSAIFAERRSEAA